MISLSPAEARQFLTAYHLRPTTLAGVFERLGSVQYDPLNPLGRNPDLVLQARVPGYQVDDWQHSAYHERLIYDAWDKQASLVPTSDWPLRAWIRSHYHPWHDRAVLDEHPEAVKAALDEIDRKGPLSALEFEDRSRLDGGHSWLGPTRIKRILRALWVRGVLVTHHREGVRHYYDRPERVIPPEHFTAEPLRDADAYHRWIVLRRHQAAGLLRPKAEAAIWSVCGSAATREKAIRQLVEIGDLTPVEVGTRRVLYHVPTPSLDLLQVSEPEPRMIFLAPLDNTLWDRKSIQDIFGFSYAWEVYRRPPDRRWGYYVLPVLYRDRFVGRFDSRLQEGTWRIYQWWWEEDVAQSSELLDALRDAARDFMRYLRAHTIEVADDIDPLTRAALREAAPAA